jgi:23S rRNA pseudouridine1911/1915/1917 synthase
LVSGSASPLHRQLIVATLGAPLRVDRALAAAWPDLSRSRIQALIEAGAITVNGRPARVSLLVSGGEEVRADIPAAAPLGAEPEARALDILYQDEDVAVINKPAGLTVHPSSTQRSGTLVNALLAALPDLSGIGGTLRPGIVHRLDKDTSGVLIVAKHDTAHRALVTAFQKREVDKRYVAFVVGTPPAAGEWAKPIGRHPTQRKKFSTRATTAKAALTRFTRTAQFSGTAQLELELLTGRTHQIRVHAQDAGFPLIGDRTYGAQPKSAPVCARDFPRQALHAERLTLTLPSGVRRTFVAPWPSDLLALRAALAKA